MTNLNISISSFTISRAMSRDELIKFIIEMDSDIAEVDFTLKLIKQLIRGLSEDEPIEWIANELGFKLKMGEKSKYKNLSS